MIPIAGVLLLIVIVFSIAVVVSNPQIFDLSIFGASVPVTTAGVYFTGAGAMLVVIVAAALLYRGVQRERARRRQVRALQHAAGVKSLPTTTRKPKETTNKKVEASEPSAGGQKQPSLSPAGRNATSANGSTKAGEQATGTKAPPRGDDLQSTRSRTPLQSQGQPASASATDTETTDVAERRALLDEAEELTGDSSDR